MSIDSVGGFSSAPDMQTLRNMETNQNQNRVQQQAQFQAPVDKQTFGAAVVAKTLDYMNTGQGSDKGMAQNYDFQKSVLGGHAAELGALANVKV